MSDFPVDAMRMPEYDASDPEQVAMAQRTVAIRDQEQTGAVRSFLSTYEGRTFMWMLLQETGADCGVFAGEAPMTMSRNEGRREVGQWGREWVFTAAPEMYMVMKREAIEREQRYASAAGFEVD